MTSPEEKDTTPLKFGKYKGVTPEEVAKNDPQYLCWLYEMGHKVCSRALYLAAESTLEDEIPEVWDDDDMQDAEDEY